VNAIATHAASTASTADTARGHVGRIVTLTMLGGLLMAVAAVIGPLAGSKEHVITGSVLAVFAASWTALAAFTTRWTDQPQRWAAVPAAVMAVAAVTVLVLAPTGNQLGWVWPPAILGLVAWMGVSSRRDLRSRSRVLVLYPVLAALAVSALGGAYETYAETTDPSASDMPGRLVDVGDRKLHISCTGTGSPTVVLEPGLGEASPIMAAWIAPDVATTTRVCVFDRAGRGWSDAAPGPQDGEQAATDLHTLLAEAGEPGPYVLAGHSAGGIYVLDFVSLFPVDVAGVVLLDSMHPEQYERMASWPTFYEMYRRVSAVAPSLSRIGLGRLVYSTEYSDLPPVQRDQQRAFLATPRHSRSVRDELSQIRTAMAQAARVTDLGDRPLAVLSATEGAEDDWMPMQDDLATLSTDSVHRILTKATHEMVVGDESTAQQSSQLIVDVVTSIRTSTPLNAQEG